MADDGQILADTVARFTFWANERIKNTFKDDAYKAIVDRLGERAAIQRSAPVDNTLAEFPADAIVRPASPAGTPAPVTAVFFVQSPHALNEALMLWMEARQFHRPVRIAALVEDGTINPTPTRRNEPSIASTPPLSSAATRRQR